MVSDLIASPAVVSEEQDVEEIYWHAYAAIPHYAYTKPAAVKSYLSWLKRRTKKGLWWPVSRDVRSVSSP